jgi:S-DNA-T family DNA segregation ATPase FtsK/SpoIIIE
MAMSTRDNMRRELKELAKLAETMGKDSPAASTAAQAPDSIAFPAAASLERPVTPASSSRVSVGPFATSTAPPVFETPEPSKPSGSRTGFIAVVVGAGLAVALVGGAFVGKSLAGSSGSAVAPVTAAAAAIAPQTPVAAPPEVAVALPPAAVPQAPPVRDPAIPAPTASPVSASGAASPAGGGAPVHKHTPKAATPVKAPVFAAVAATTPANASDGVAAPKPVGGPALAKPKAASAGGGGDSLEDLIRKEVAAQKK